MPESDFQQQVDEFDDCDEIWDQEDYEERLQTEAELMIALEAIRGTLVELDEKITQLEECVELNQLDIGDNFEHINVNDQRIAENDIEIEKQKLRLEELQWRCRDC